MSRYTSLKHHFLIAMPALADPLFARSVAYICEHTEEGAMGLIVNHPLNHMCLSDILGPMRITGSNTHTLIHQPIYAGGPVQRERGFVLHRPTRKRWQSSLRLQENLSITSSRDILEAMAKEKGPIEAMIALGYAGWGSGQLEEEIRDNLWLCCPADPDLLFSVPNTDRWQAAAHLAGIRLEHMSFDVGHA